MPAPVHPVVRLVVLDATDVRGFAQFHRELLLNTTVPDVVAEPSA